MKGLQGKNEFSRKYTSEQMEITQRLAEIEQEDEDRCVNCGGEDCVCCEYYHDRQKRLTSILKTLAFGIKPTK